MLLIVKLFDSYRHRDVGGDQRQHLASREMDERRRWGEDSSFAKLFARCDGEDCV
jgi:hypothetical protein